MMPASINITTNSRLIDSEEHLVLSYFNDDNSILQTISLSGSELTLPSQNYSGIIEHQILGLNNNSDFYSTMTFENGMLINIENNISSAGRVMGDCTTRDVFTCVGEKFEGWSAENLSCYVGFGLCFGVRTLDCYISECWQ